MRQLEAHLEGTTADPNTLAEVIGGVARSYRRWLDIGSEDTPSAAWVLLGPADSVAEPAAWLTDLAQMYQGWFRRKGMSYEVVAEQIDRSEPRRLVIEVEGPGVLQLLEMEQGEHRRRGRNGTIERAMVEVIPRRDGSVPPVGAPPVLDAKRGRGVAIERRRARVDLDVAGRGLQLRFYGTSRESLQWMARDLGAALASPTPSQSIARTYGMRGGRCRIPAPAPRSPTSRMCCGATSSRSSRRGRYAEGTTAVGRTPIRTPPPS